MIGVVLGIIIAIRMKKGFWAGLGFSILGWILFSNLGKLIWKDEFIELSAGDVPEEVTVTVNT